MSSLAESIGSVAAVSGPTALGIAAVTAGAVAAAAAIFALTKSASDYQERLDLIADSTGLTTREIGGLKVAAAASGKSFDEVRPSIDFFTRKLGEAIRNGGEAARAFEAVGLSVDRLKTLSTGQALSETGRVLRTMQDGAVKSSIAFDLFGRTSSRALRVVTSDLQANAQAAQDRGVVFSPETEQKLRNIDTAFDNLALTLEGFRASFTAAIAVRVEPFLTTLNTMHMAIINFLNREEVKTLISLMRFIERGGTPGQNQTVEVGTAPAGGPSTQPMISPEFARQLSLEEEARNRKRIEDEFNAGVKKAAEERQRVERSFLAPMIGPPSGEFFSGQVNPFRTGFQAEEMSIDDWSERVNAAVGDLNITFTEAELRSKEYKAAMEDAGAAQDKATSSVENFAGVFESTVSRFVSSAILGFETVGGAFRDLIRSMVSSIAENIFTSVVKGLINTAASVTTGGIVQIPNTPGGGIGPIPQSRQSPNQASVQVTFNAYGHFIDRKALQEFTSEQLAPILIDTMNKGALRGR
jgi:hypothetical protein